MGKPQDIIQRRISYWIDLADYDLISASAMLSAKQFLHVGFFSHQIIEKGLKALYWKKKQDEPPFTHNLIVLIQKCGIIDNLPEVFLILSEELMPLGINARYPDDKDMLLDILTREKCNEILSAVKEFLLWIKNFLKS
jgi:HEPN domain-containing protein